VFASTDTVVVTRVIADNADSVQLQVAIETREYSDSTYKAKISGPVIGDFHPTLDYIETYNTHTFTQSNSSDSRFVVTVGAGTAYTTKGLQPYVGIGVGYVLFRL
jgi:opacity protein-like surface antigen